MTLKVRRVVTGHDQNGKAVVQIDEVLSDASSRRVGMESAVAWTTQGFPVDNADDSDGSRRSGIGTTVKDGTVFRVVEYLPGVTPRIHRTDSIDYGVVVSGELILQLEDGVEVQLNAGDLFVQRGTVHNWVNRSAQPCVAAFAIIQARPVVKNGRQLSAAEFA